MNLVNLNTFSCNLGEPEKFEMGVFKVRRAQLFFCFESDWLADDGCSGMNGACVLKCRAA
jgi:hypothetical protein